MLFPKVLLFFLISNFSAIQIFSQVFTQADSSVDPYLKFNSNGWYEEETSLHPGFKHIKQVWNNELNKYIFEFILHKDLDGDGAERIDRQRLEIKTYGPSPDDMKAAKGETHTYRWKFKLDENFKATSNFCHIHQLKAGDGPDASSPLMTITPRLGSPDSLELIYTAPTGLSGGGKLKKAALSLFKGVWVEAYEVAKFDILGTYSLQIKRVSDDSLLFSYINTNINMWRTGSTFIRPKFGIYRSLGTNLSQLPNLRDETVLFSDFYLYEGTNLQIPFSPSSPMINFQSNSIKLSWNSTPLSAGQFKIDRSTDGVHFHYLKTVSGTAFSSTDTDLPHSNNLFYRIRSENAAGNSSYLYFPVATGVQSEYKMPDEFNLSNYPNPFNPETTIIYSVPQPGLITLKIYDLLGREISCLRNLYEQAGIHKIKFTADKLNAAGGIYFARLVYGKQAKTIKLNMVK